MEETLISFLNQKGTIDILSVIPIDGVSRTEIEEEVRITNKTVGSRLQRGRDLEVWVREPSHRKEGGRYDYFLTDRGQKLQVLLVYHRLPQIISEIKSKEKEFERQKDQVTDLIEEYGVEEAAEMYDEDFST